LQNSRKRLFVSSQLSLQAGRPNASAACGTFHFAVNSIIMGWSIVRKKGGCPPRLFVTGESLGGYGHALETYDVVEN
jgi:uncharacterized membrane protein